MRRRLVYRGRVQGVGFRYTTASIAKRFPVTGYVKNLRNGDVEVVVDGPETEMTQFLDEIAASFEGNIEDCLSEEYESAEQFESFRIRFS